jgi:predicted DNA-binding transcriptional regulator AlpA
MTDEDDLFTLKEACRFFGGSGKPIDRTTFYRWIGRGLVPAPIKVGPHQSRWRKSACIAALKKMEERT